MQIFKDINAFQTYRDTLPTNLSIGFIPTMGHLHRGHASLIERSKQDNDLTFVSIFVNPTQFNQAEDFNQYPRTLEADLTLLNSLGVDACLAPLFQDLYPDNYQYQMTETTLSTQLEGQFRPGHFNGVLTIVLKLLMLTKPNKVYFGEKDFQQLTLIQGMVKAFFLPIKVIGCETIRETSQLAMSSRNSRLSFEEKQQAEKFAKIFHSPIGIAEKIQRLNALGIEVEYLEPLVGRLFAAVKIGNIRLIDNYKI